MRATRNRVAAAQDGGRTVEAATLGHCAQRAQLMRQSKQHSAVVESLARSRPRLLEPLTIPDMLPLIRAHFVSLVGDGESQPFQP